MGEVVNLRTRRKARARAEREKAAESNRLLHGRSKAAREAEQAERERAERLIDAHRREPAGGSDPA